MTISLTHSTVVAVPDDAVSPVGTNEWNAQHNLTLAANRMMGRLTSDGAAQELTPVQVTTFVASSSTGGTVNFLRADGTWAVPPTNLTLTVGTNPITGGASGNFLFDNAGVLGEQTPTQVTATLGVFSGTLKGLAPASGGGTTNFLRADGTWAAPPTSVTLGVGSSPITGGASASYLFDNGGTLGEQTPVQLTAALGLFTATLKGLTPASAGGTTNFLRADGSWAAPPPAGSGVQSLNGLTGTLSVVAGTGILVSAATGNITVSGVVFSPTLNGDVPASGGGTTNYLRADGTWNPPPLPVVVGAGQCRLKFQSATQIVLNRQDGSKLKINGALYDIPSAGVSANPTSCFLNGVASQALVAGTTYNVFAWMNGATMALDFSATAHVSDTTAGNDGVEVKSGDSTRSLVGKVYVFAGPAFNDAPTQRGVLSWFNRRQRVVQANAIGLSTSSTSWTQGNPQVFFLDWGDEEVWFEVSGNTYNTNIASCYTMITMDGTTNVLGYDSEVGMAAPNTSTAVAASGATRVSEGIHNFWTMVAVNGGTGFWNVVSTATFFG